MGGRLEWGGGWEGEGSACWLGRRGGGGGGRHRWQRDRGRSKEGLQGEGGDWVGGGCRAVAPQGKPWRGEGGGPEGPGGSMGNVHAG